MVEALVSTNLRPPKFRYSQLVKAGPNYVSSGMVALDNESGKIISGDAGDQTRCIFKNILLLMEEFTLTLADLVIVRIYTTRFSQFPEINVAWEEIFKEGTMPPARTAMEVSTLPLNALVEIEFNFYKVDGVS